MSSYISTQSYAPSFDKTSQYRKNQGVSKTAEEESDVKTPRAESRDLTDAAIFEKSEESESQPTTYGPNLKTIQNMKEEGDQKVATFRTLVTNLILKQGMQVDDVLKRIQNGENVDIPIDEETKAAATAAIAEDGEWGVKKTSARILDFAKALSGGDPEKIEPLRAAFAKGYNQAAKQWGDALPQICQDTYDAVMKGFDDWAKEAAEASGSAKADGTVNQAGEVAA